MESSLVWGHSSFWVHFFFIKIISLHNLNFLTSFLNVMKSSYSHCYFAVSLYGYFEVSLMYYINLDAIFSAFMAVLKGRTSTPYKNKFKNNDHGNSQFYLYWILPKAEFLNIIINSVPLVFALCIHYFYSFPI